ncbi:hypothetical protein TL16_g00701 [Triparma laevis f. inornata]|uniref:Uncharacterized protein n=2 Tax=Triparma laevis TaxID=1534972 RepID=A0A9W7CC22_9STRA|nr:hypothetical protein TL16_g00701 [Triparma laevis f. inornata]GMI01919.1 hypothetical protein TrLO_g8129 [Triparma laevis f. longispina]
MEVINYRTAFDVLRDRRDSHIVLRALVGLMELLSPSPLLPPLTLRTVLEYVLVSVVARQILLMTIIYIISLILIIPVYILDVIVFDYTVLDIIVMYFVVSAICRFVKRSLAFPRGYCSDYWGIWAPTLNTLNATFEKTFNDASGLPPDHPLRNLDVLPPYNLHHIKMVREVAESLTIYKEDQERWEFLEDVKFCLENSEGTGSDPAKGVIISLERMLAENDATTPIRGNVLRAAFLASLNQALQNRDATFFAQQCGQYGDIIESQLEFLAEAIHSSTTDVISCAHILADPRNMMNDDGNWTIVSAIIRAVKNALKLSSASATDFDLVLFPFGYIRQGRLKNLNRRKGVEASNVAIRGTGKREGLIEAVWVKKEGSKGTVIYCNPNAGVWELTGLNLGLGVGGGGRMGDEAGWIETYLQMGYDVVAFNYRGYGRSCFYPPSSSPSFLLKFWRWFRDWFGSGGLKPASLKNDGVVVCDAVVGAGGNSKLIVHGESIGGMVAASAAEGRDDDTLLIVDRSFKCLEAVAENMLGGWVGVAMRVFLRGWNSDIVTSFEKKRGAKLICQDPFDQIINYTASLMVGVSWKKEVLGDLEQHMFPARVREEYVRMGEGRESEGGGLLFAPEKIAGGDKLGLENLTKFAAAVRSIGIRVTKGNKRAREGLDPMAAMETNDFSDSDSDASEDEETGGGGARAKSASSSAGWVGEGELRELNLAWNLLSVCDGLGGMGLGSAAKLNLEAVCIWLCVCLRTGPCIVRRRSKRRTGGGEGIIESDFDPRNPGGGRTARGGVALPAVLKGLKELRDSAGSWGQEVKKEIEFIILILDYTVETVKERAGGAAGEEEVQVVNLVCGHNAALGAAEMQELKYFIGKWEIEGGGGGGGGAGSGGGSAMLV